MDLIEDWKMKLYCYLVFIKVGLHTLGWRPKSYVSYD